ncbi:LLM class F420-dependent oxidoreductase [Candidatus Poriferisocius sp.]|uniref:LLM class F420-dependent oxidoreductase n=1 Tax=Candidatus Poriferisocius sp. TaxID=3101276 RepID=UPI003B029852
MDIGRIGLWQGVLDQQPSNRVREIVAELEELGWPTLWIPEAVGRDPFVSASVMLGATSTLKVATGIVQIHARHPMTTAAAQKTVAEAFGNRFLLGIGVSHGPFIEGIRKLDYSKPYSFMVDYLDAMEGAMFMAAGPEQSPPLVLAALGPRMLALATERTAGAHPYFVPPEHTAGAREIMGPDALLAPEQKVCLETDPDKARSLARENMAMYMGLPNYVNNLHRLGFTEADTTDLSDRLVDAIVAWGDLDSIAARIQAHHDAGADHVAVQVLTPRGELPIAQWRTLAGALL